MLSARATRYLPKVATRRPEGMTLVKIQSLQLYDHMGRSVDRTLRGPGRRANLDVGARAPVERVVEQLEEARDIALVQGVWIGAQQRGGEGGLGHGEVGSGHHGWKDALRRAAPRAWKRSGSLTEEVLLKIDG